MTQINNQRQADYGNAIATAIGGGTMWGIGQYLFNKRPFIDGSGNIKDTFVKSMEDALVEIKDKATIENIDFQKGLEKDVDALKTKDEIKEFISNRKKDFMRMTDDDIKLLNEELTKLETEEAKTLTKKVFKADGKYQKFYKDALDSCYDTGGKLKHDATKISEKNWNALKEVIQKARRNSALKAAGVFAGVCAFCCCLFEFLGSRKK